MFLSDIIPTRNLNLFYVICDSIFVILFMLLLFLKKKRLTLIFALCGGVLYFLVDYFIFHLLSGSRTIIFNNNQSELITFLVLLWMSLSYGITNFAYIWLCLKKDKDLKLWLLLIILWWLICPTLQEAIKGNEIITMRTTNKYHYVMAIILIVGYMLAIVYNLFSTKENKKIPIFRLLIIGISVQFAWEFSLLINGIRPLNEASFKTIILNSLIETNLGMPYLYVIYKFISSKFNEDGSKLIK